jgi:Fic family protein
MEKNSAKKPFVQPFLKDFVLAADILPFSDPEILKLDKELSEYEQVFMDPDVEKHLISRNEFMASFAISKAEASSLTLFEAQEVYDIVLEHKNYDFIQKKLAQGKKLTRRDYERLEFFNIAKTFREINQKGLTVRELTSDSIRNIHGGLTLGMDIFHEYITGFTAYKSGKWRDNDTIRVGNYVPAPYKEIPGGVDELVSWLKENPSITSVAVFHTALYALHPFHNGNKRVCRILEHVLLRDLGLNEKNLYSTSYYYHKQKERYYKYLLQSLERKNLNHFTSFVLEALVTSMIYVIKTSLDAKRKSFLENVDLDEKEKAILRPLIKRQEMQFKILLKLTKKKVARQTFVTYVQRAVERQVLTRREKGRVVYYSFALKTPEREVLEKWIAFARERLSYVPHDILLS